jgi:hypothetical protein
VSDDKIQQLVADLDSKRFIVREKAMKELKKIFADCPFRLETLLNAAWRNGSPEVQWRVAEILQYAYQNGLTMGIYQPRR